MSEDYVTPLIRVSKVVAVEVPNEQATDKAFCKVWFEGGAVLEIESSYARKIAEAIEMANESDGHYFYRLGLGDGN